MLFWILLIAILILSIWAQYQVSHQFRKYSQVQNRRFLTGAEAASAVLARPRRFRCGHRPAAADT